MKSLNWLALAPLLGASDLLIKSLGLSMVALPLLIVLGVLAGLLRRLDATLLRAVLLLAACALLTFADLLMQATALELRYALGMFLPLLLVAAVQAPANAPQGLRHGLLFSGAALLLGALRELLGRGTLLSHGEWLFGPAAVGWSIPGVTGLPLFALAPGAFILLGVLWALSRLMFAPSRSSSPSADPTSDERR